MHLCIKTSWKEKERAFSKSCVCGLHFYVGPADFSALDVLLTFNASTERIPVQILIVNDDIDENSENLLSRLRLESVDASVSVTPDEATILILDDDGEYAHASFSVN